MADQNQQFDHRILDNHNFGVVAPSATDDLPQGIVARAMVPDLLTASAHLMPQLVDLRTLNAAQTDALLTDLHLDRDAGEPPAMAMLLRATSSADDCARHWNRLQLVSPRSGSKSWLRMHDPRVMHQVLRILTPQQRSKLHARWSAITYWLGGAWITVVDANDSPAADERAQPTLPQATPEWDWQRIEDIGVINRAFQQAGIESLAAIDSSSVLAEALIARARQQHRLQDNADLIEFVVRGLAYGADFDSHPSVAPHIAPRDDASLDDRLALIGDEVWDALRTSTAAST